jgi:hypothetical protein
MFFRMFNSEKKAANLDPPAIETKVDEIRESHWTKYCAECPEDCACKNYEV